MQDTGSCDVTEGNVIINTLATLDVYWYLFALDNGSLKKSVSSSKGGSRSVHFSKIWLKCVSCHAGSLTLLLG